MARQLIAHVHVYDGDGRAHVFGPGDNVPDELAKRITNPAVWESNRDSDDDPSESWTVADLKAYAELHDIDLGEATKKADILAVIAQADDRS
ncbi:hypothetical protein CRM89_00345 [Nocardia sp. FDAARGOS_372]|nr:MULTISPECIES: hypothetical protein [Nocardia]PEH74635.1 hypothetical protein CRM89_00345 [Nocardia sp. FDAARGOS_372]